MLYLPNVMLTWVNVLTGVGNIYKPIIDNGIFDNALVTLYQNEYFIL